MTTSTLALAILGAILLQLALVLLFGLWRRRRELHGLGAPLVGADGAAWPGWREFRVVRREYEDAGRSICSFYLEPVDGVLLPPFLPGQFLTFRLPHEGGSVVRCYSLSDAPRADHYRVSIKRVGPAQPELPAGVGSNYFHDQLLPGERVEARAPSGHFHLQPPPPLPLVLVGGGIGITPMLSILHSVLEGGAGRELWLFYGVRHGGEAIQLDTLRALAARHSQFHLQLCYSAPVPGEVVGVDYHHAGRIDLALLRNTLPLQRYQFYVCGPSAMMESLVPGLEAWGVATADIHYESFGPATLTHRQQREAPAADDTPIAITFSRSGKVLAWDSNAESLLEFAEDHGIKVESGCRAGSCGCCATVLRTGEVEYLQTPDALVLPGHCLLCITIPNSAITLEL